jgi:hypothetical protein
MKKGRIKRGMGYFGGMELAGSGIIHTFYPYLPFIPYCGIVIE